MLSRRFKTVLSVLLTFYDLHLPIRYDHDYLPDQRKDKYKIHYYDGGRIVATAPAEHRAGISGATSTILSPSVIQRLLLLLSEHLFIYHLWIIFITLTPTFPRVPPVGAVPQLMRVNGGILLLIIVVVLIQLPHHFEFILN